MNADAPISPPPPDVPPSSPTETPPADVAPAPEAPLVPPPKPATWPEWFASFDVALAIMAVVLAFLMGSFVARNSDLWRHLAAGRLVTQGQYPFGGDPFTFTAADRVWVNAHWLGEVVLYAAYSADTSGVIAVAIKAIAFAAAIGLLFQLRKPGFALWPWAVAAVLGTVAAGAFTHLRPQVLGLPLMAGFLVVLYSGDWSKGNPWRMPAVLGGLTALWANVDGFAILSPVLVGLVLLGEWLHPKVFPAKGDLPADDDPFRLAPPIPALFRALLLCVVGVLLNPTFLAGLTKDPGEAVAQLLPFELDWSAGAELQKDPDLKRATYSAVNREYLANPMYGQNPAGYTALALWLLGGVAAGVGFRNGRLSHLLVWVVLTLLAAVVHARFVPYAALVGIPFLAAHLNGLNRYVPPLGQLPHAKGRGLVNGCRAGRILTLVVVLLVLVSAVPGWLHPWSGSAASRRYVAWGVEPDAGMKRAGEVFAGWHADPAKAEVLAASHNLNTHPDLGDYLAWYAPAEKSFVTSRFRLHRSELADLVTARAAVFMELLPNTEELPTQIEQLRPVADKYDIGYVTVAQAGAAPPVQAVLNSRYGLGVIRADDRRLVEAPWNLDGRMLVIGRTDTSANAARSQVMRWDVAAAAFAPQEPVAAPPELEFGIPPERGWEYDLLLIRPPLPPIELEDAACYDRYVNNLVPYESFLRAQAVQAAWLQTAVQIGGGPLVAAPFVGLGPLPDPEPQDKEFALPYLIARSARRGLLADPNAGLGYFLLAQAYQKSFLPSTDSPPLFGETPFAPSDRELQSLTALNRALVRFPPPGVEDETAENTLRTRALLVLLYLQVGQEVPVVPNKPSAIGYVDAAKRVVSEMVVAAEIAPTTALVNTALALDPLWRRVYDLCEQDFWIELQQFAAAGRVPPEWQRKLQSGGIFDLLIERNYLKADDDPRKWFQEFNKSAQARSVDPQEVKLRLARLAEVLEKLLLRRTERVQRGSQNQPEQQYLQYIAAGLPEAALRLVLPGEGEKKLDVPVSSADVLRLMLWVGRAEEVQQRIETERRTVNDSTTLPAVQRAVLKEKFRLLDFELAKLNGDYAKADVLYQELLAAPLGDLPVGRFIDQMMFGDLWRPSLFRPLTATELTLFEQLRGLTLPPVSDSVVVSAGGVWAWAAGTREQLRQRLLFQAFTRYQRGVYALLGGDTSRAKELFDAAATPQGVPLDQVGVPPDLAPALGQFLPKYRTLLARYAK